MKLISQTHCLSFILHLLSVKVVSTEITPDKKALKLVRLQDRGLNVLTTTDKYVFFVHFLRR